MIRGALLDFDGTLVDTHPFLYRVYVQFLAERGIEGTEGEFASLLGPSLREGVKTLVERHGLEGGLDVNYAAYYRLLQPGEGVLFPGVLPFLRFAEAHRLRLGIVTSAPKAWVEAILLNLKVLHYFQFVVSGDSLPRGKPAPDPYLKGISEIQLAKDELIAVEDTEMGAESARSAGLKTYFPDWEKLLREVAESYYPTLIEGPELHLERVEAPDFTDRQIKVLETHFKARSLENEALFNGPLYFYHSHDKNNLRIYRGDYKLYLGRHLISDREILPLAVSGKTTCDPNILWGKRALKLSQFGGFWETVPSGGLAQIDPVHQLLDELQEEVHIPRNEVKKTTFLKAVQNLKEGTLELLYHISLTRPNARRSQEVVDLRWDPHLPPPDYPLLPLSLYLSRL